MNSLSAVPERDDFLSSSDRNNRVRIAGLTGSNSTKEGNIYFLVLDIGGNDPYIRVESGIYPGFLVDSRLNSNNYEGWSQEEMKSLDFTGFFAIPTIEESDGAQIKLLLPYIGGPFADKPPFKGAVLLYLDNTYAKPEQGVKRL